MPAQSRYTVGSCCHGGRILHLVHHLTRGSMGSDLFLELGPDDLDELAGPSGADPEPDTLGVSGYRLLVSHTMSRVFSPRLSQENLRRAPNDCLLATLLGDVLVELGLSLRRTVIRVRMDSRLGPLDVAYGWHTARRADRLQ